MTAAWDWGGVEHSTAFLDGAAIEGILDRSVGSDLVVIGTHGRTGLSLAVLGGVAHAVLRGSQVPILAVPCPDRVFRV